MVQASKCILNNSLNLDLWLQRSVRQLHLGFPELDAGDARKSSLLCKAMLSEDAPFIEGMAKLQIDSFPRLKSREQACPPVVRNIHAHMLL